jgi:bifunctional non-homologous end joining protein LigD
MIGKERARAVTFCVFDVLWLNGTDCTQLPYSHRRDVLDMLDLQGSAWCTIPTFSAEDSAALLDACARFGHEGIVLKQVDSKYVSGARSRAWRKAKTPAWRASEAPRRLPAEVRARMQARE